MDIVVSIPYTGTRFIKTRLSIKYHVHTTCSWDQIQTEVGSSTIIAPLRDPYACWHSATRRWRNNTAVAPFNVSRFVQGWMMMHAVTLWRQVDFIAVDLRDDERIRNWEPVGDTDPGNAVHPAIDLTFLYDLPFVKAFYRNPAKQPSHL